MCKAAAEAEAKSLRPEPRPKFWPRILASRPLWPRGLNITASNVLTLSNIVAAAQLQTGCPRP